MKHVVNIFSFPVGVRGDESAEVEGNTSATNSAVSNDSRPLSSEWTVSQFIENRRKFNIDLSPKVILFFGFIYLFIR